MTTILIMAISRNGCIGKGNKIPWSNTEEMTHFKTTTTGHSVVMGTNTWRSFNPRKVLPNRLNIVLTRSQQTRSEITLLSLPNLYAASDISEVNELHLNHAKSDNLYIIGGQQIYDLYLDSGRVERAIISTIEEDVVDGDTFFDSSKLSNLHLDTCIIKSSFTIREYYAHGN